MDIFISWSGERSGQAAEILNRWLRRIIQHVQPWISKEIHSGARWGNEIAVRLQDTKFGILCITDENLESPWIMFEAGALAKTLQDSYVCPYLIDNDLKPSDLLKTPLSQFQARSATKEETLQLVLDINSVLKTVEHSITDEELKDIFDKHYWKELREDLEKLPKTAKPRQPRTTEQMLEEVLDILAKRQEPRANVDFQLPAFVGEQFREMFRRPPSKADWDFMRDFVEQLAKQNKAKAGFAQAPDPTTQTNERADDSKKDK